MKKIYLLSLFPAYQTLSAQGWVPQSSVTPAELYTGATASPYQIFAGGSAGTLLHSTEGRNTWLQKTTSLRTFFGWLTV